jgi:hypothetical protein
MGALVASAGFLTGLRLFCRKWAGEKWQPLLPQRETENVTMRNQTPTMFKPMGKIEIDDFSKDVAETTAL